jgi:glycosyltransferase involved in cell wall biosynthesis
MTKQKAQTTKSDSITDTLYFDARYIRVDHHDGISRFSAGLCDAISKRIDTVAIICDDRQLESLPAGIKSIKITDPTSLLGEALIARKLNQLNAKLVFSPMQTMGTLTRKYKLLLTLHDLIYYAHPAAPPSLQPHIRLGWRLFHSIYWPQRVLLNAADAVVTVSQTTKALIEKHRLTKRQVHVVYNAAAHNDEQHEVAHSRPTGSQKLVYMGSFMDYKNVETLVLAMNKLPDYELHLLSRITDERKAELKSLSSLPNVIFHNGVSDVEYLAHLDDAVALVSASLDEGFGIPVIEAMGRGCPAIISDIEIFREVGGSAARFFEPKSAEQFSSQVLSLESKAEWRKTSKASLDQAKKFNWEASADELLEAIGSLYSEK